MYGMFIVQSSNIQLVCTEFIETIKMMKIITQYCDKFAKLLLPTAISFVQYQCILLAGVQVKSWIMKQIKYGCNFPHKHLFKNASYVIRCTTLCIDSAE